METLVFCLQPEGYEVLTASDGTSALELARREEPDLMVLDVMLPKENGYPVARYLREDAQLGRIRKRPAILILTARTISDEERERFLKTWSGADSFMYKPFDMEELVSRVNALALSS